MAGLIKVLSNGKSKKVLIARISPDWVQRGLFSVGRLFALPKAVSIL